MRGGTVTTTPAFPILSNKHFAPQCQQSQKCALTLSIEKSMAIGRLTLGITSICLRDLSGSKFYWPCIYTNRNSPRIKSYSSLISLSYTRNISWCGHTGTFSSSRYYIGLLMPEKFLIGWVMCMLLSWLGGLASSAAIYLAGNHIQFISRFSQESSTLLRAIMQRRCQLPFPTWSS